MKIINVVLMLALICPLTVNAAEDLSAITNAGGTVYFAWDGESGNYNSDAGTGHFSALGGLVTGPAGSGCSDPAIYHNTILSTDAAVSGTHSLKTPYSGACTNEGFNRDTTFIETGTNLYEGYVRWYQRWTGDWNSASNQQKFTKFYDGVGTPLVHFSFAGGQKIWRNWLPNIDGHFNKGTDTLGWSSVWVFSSQAGMYCATGCTYDDFDNGVGGTDGEITFQNNRWYEIEVHWKANTDANTSDAVMEAWIDGVQTFGAYNFKYFNTGNRPYVSVLELQHIYYNRSANDQPTYMDNIVIASMHIGGISGSSPIDTTAPIVTSFTCASGNKLRDITCTGTATDDTGVTGYCLTTSADSAGCRWQTAGVFRHKPAASGAYTYHLFARDAAGNVSITTDGSVASKVVETCGCN